VHSAIFDDKERAEREFPVPILQCLQIKPLGPQGEGSAEHYRVVWSDVHNFVQSKLATRMYLTPQNPPLSALTPSKEANHVIHDGKLKKGSIVRLKQWQAHSIKDKKFVYTSSPLG
jgi:replication factor A1